MQFMIEMQFLIAFFLPENKLDTLLYIKLYLEV